jgi:hypothetical protein
MKSFGLMIPCPNAPRSVAESRRATIVFVETSAVVEKAPLCSPQGLRNGVKFAGKAKHLG